jgi:cytochrome c biogenesis protein
VTGSKAPARPTVKGRQPNKFDVRTEIVRLARKGWRRLISMRTALVLLFLLAIASVPGSLLPQKPLNPTKVQQYLSEHGAWGRFLNRMGFLDVFGSPWFAAIYLLLAISLVGCLVPRIRLHAKALRARPLPAPRNLDRLPESDAFVMEEAPEDAAARLRRRLGRRWRTEIRTEKRGVVTVSAEKGYSRETGNLIFHIALLVALVVVAVGRLWGYQGSVVLTEGSAFCNQVSQYDSWKPGRFAQDGRVASFCIDDLEKFTATYLDTGEPKQFAADIAFSRGADGRVEHKQIRVNHPLRVEGDRVYLIGHGFAPTVTVTMPDGTTTTNTVPFIPQDPNTYYSEGAFSFLGKADADGTHTQDIGLSGFFAPTPISLGNGAIGSAGPQATDPVLGVFVYQGDVGNDGLARSVYTLDDTLISSGRLTEIGQGNLRVGDTLQAENGVTVRFDGWKQWVSLQISHDPTQGYLLLAAAAMVIGLLGSLGVRRRRVWLRLEPAERTPKGRAADGTPTLVSMGGLARSDSGNFTEEFRRLRRRLSGEDGELDQ